MNHSLQTFGALNYNLKKRIVLNVATLRNFQHHQPRIALQYDGSIGNFYGNVDKIPWDELSETGCSKDALEVFTMLRDEDVFEVLCLGRVGTITFQFGEDKLLTLTSTGLGTSKDRAIVLDLFNVRKAAVAASVVCAREQSSGAPEHWNPGVFNLLGFGFKVIIAVGIFNICTAFAQRPLK